MKNVENGKSMFCVTNEQKLIKHTSHQHHGKSEPICVCACACVSVFLRSFIPAFGLNIDYHRWARYSMFDFANYDWRKKMVHSISITPFVPHFPFFLVLVDALIPFSRSFAEKREQVKKFLSFNRNKTKNREKKIHSMITETNSVNDFQKDWQVIRNQGKNWNEFVSRVEEDSVQKIECITSFPIQLHLYHLIYKSTEFVFIRIVFYFHMIRCDALRIQYRNTANIGNIGKKQIYRDRSKCVGGGGTERYQETVISIIWWYPEQFAWNFLMGRIRKHIHVHTHRSFRLKFVFALCLNVVWDSIKRCTKSKFDVRAYAWLMSSIYEWCRSGFIQSNAIK